MQATSSQVTDISVSAAPIFTVDSIEEDAGGLILPVLKQAARDSGRDHLLVRRRRRSTRRRAH